MAANLTPQYLEAEAEYKRAQTAEERLACLKKMYSLLPKHPKKIGVSYKIPKQGAGQYVLVGGPNVGKSRLLSRLTRATPEVAAYPFTTHEPLPGMMEWEDVR